MKVIEVLVLASLGVVLSFLYQLGTGLSDLNDNLKDMRTCVVEQSKNRTIDEGASIIDYCGAKHKWKERG